MIWALIAVAIWMLLGFVLRIRWALLRRLHIPASVVAGGLALIWVQSVQPFTDSDSFWFHDLIEHWKSWPGWLIALVFAGMLLDKPKSSAKDSLRRAGREGLMVWIIVLGETAVGLLVTWWIVGPVFGVPDAFGMLIETGFAGGHGTATAMGEVFASEQVGWQAGRDLGLLVATVGLVYGLVSGVVWINLGVRLGWVRSQPSNEAKTNRFNATITQDSSPNSQVDGEEPVPSNALSATPSNPHTPNQDRSKEFGKLEPLWIQLIWLAIAMAIGLLIQSAVGLLGTGLDGWFANPSESNDAIDQSSTALAERTSISSILGSFPLFIYTLFGGWIVHTVLRAIGSEDWIDRPLIGRISGIAMDVLIVSAIATLNLQAVSAQLPALAILLVFAAIWTGFCLLVLSRWILPRDHWFELGLINYGMSTGTTATGFVLLRMVDQELESGAAEDYALAAPLSSPFIGGGMITIGLPLLVLGRFPIAWVAITLVAVIVGLILTGHWIARRSD